MRALRRQPGPPRSPGPVTLIVVGIAAFAGAFGVARAAGGEGSADPPATVDARPLALQTATDLPALKDEPGPSAAELEAKREARERARKKKLAKERQARERAEKKAAREERLRLKAERRAQRIAEQEAERQAAAEQRKQARGEKRRQEQQDSKPEEPATPSPNSPTTTTPAPVPFDDSG